MNCLKDFFLGFLKFLLGAHEEVFKVNVELLDDSLVVELIFFFSNLFIWPVVKFSIQLEAILVFIFGYLLISCCVAVVVVTVVIVSLVGPSFNCCQMLLAESVNMGCLFAGS